VVVDPIDIREMLDGITGRPIAPTVPLATPTHIDKFALGMAGSVADTVFIAAPVSVYDVVEPPVNQTSPHTSQSPAVKEIDVILAATPDDKDMALPINNTELTNSPTLPDAALLLVVVPIIPEVEVKVKLVAEAAPSTGVTNVGDVEPTKLPVPVAPESPLPTALIVVKLLSY
jgi:hypothetical protein